jgi:excinuclease ABC subunit C
VKSNITKKIQSAPNTPGVYVFKNANERVIYVGKAIKLKTRLRSYKDTTVLRQYPKTRRLMENATFLDYFTTDTELEALVLESNLIKKYKPKYNVSLKDDKAYKYIYIAKAKDGSYKVSTTRKKQVKGSYFGPYPSGRAVNKVLKDIRKLFPFRDCTVSKFNYYKKAKRPCLYGYIGLCEAPCQGGEQTEANNKNVDKIKRYLRGDYKKVLRELNTEMKEYSKSLKYEEAAKVRDKLNYYEYLSTKYQSQQELILGVGEIEKNGFAVEYLISLLSYYFPKLKNINPEKFKIEVFDISNTGSEIIVGSQIAMLGETFDKDNYRRYKIKNQKEQDDFSAMGQMLKRRMGNISKWGKPDLILIDGGKGQLSSVLQHTDKHKIPTVSLAKKDETIFVKTGDKFSSLDLSKNDPALNILIKGRDETHRFGLAYNKKLRSKRK